MLLLFSTLLVSCALENPSEVVETSTLEARAPGAVAPSEAVGAPGDEARVAPAIGAAAER
jgi:hypothetical protein